MTYKILTDNTNKVIFCSAIRTARDSSKENLRASREAPSEPHPIIKSRIDDDEHLAAHGETEKVSMSMPIIDVEELIGRTFLLPREDGQSHRAKIVEAIVDHQRQTEEHPLHKQFRCSVNNEKYEEVISYNDIMSYLEKDKDNPVMWKFKCIVAHQGCGSPRRGPSRSQGGRTPSCCRSASAARRGSWEPE